MLLTDTSATAKIQIEALPASGFRSGIQPRKFRPGAHQPPLALSASAGASAA
jgi:hypothetical protein